MPCLRLPVLAAVYDGGAIAIDTAMARASSSKQLSTDSSLAQNQTEDSSAVEVECFNSSFTGNTAGERGGSLFSTTVRLGETDYQGVRSLAEGFYWIGGGGNDGG